MNTDGTGREEGGTEGEEVADGTEQDGPYEIVEMLPCEFCNDVFAFHELTAHQAVCAGNIRHRFQAILATQEMRTDERLAAGFNRIREAAAAARVAASPDAAGTGSDDGGDGDAGRGLQ